MRYNIFFLFFISSTLFYGQDDLTIKTRRKHYLNLIDSHPFSDQIKTISPNIKGKLPPRAYFMEDYLRTMDPETGKTYREKIYQTYKQIERGQYTNISSRLPGDNISPWTNRGPMEVGGRVRAIIYDPKDTNHKAVYAGGVSGGLWYNQDITDSNSEWTNLSQFWANTSISCIAVDPNNSNIMYVGTGEIYTRDATGAGIFRTMDGGASWEQIFYSTPLYNGSHRRGIFYITDIKVRNNNGLSEIFAGVGGHYDYGIYSGYFDAGLYKSIDNGNTFSRLSGLYTGSNFSQNEVHYTPNDIEISPVDNSIWIGTNAQSNPFLVKTGGTVFRSVDGNNFSKVYDEPLTPSGNSTGRVQIALSNQNANKAYILYNTIQYGSAPLIKVTTDLGQNWQTASLPNDVGTGVPATDFCRGQAWYDLVITLDPRNDDVVYVGGINLFKTTNSGTSWDQISKWAWGNNLRNLPVSHVHADQHAIVFNPGNNSEMLFGNDGGIYYVADNSTFYEPNYLWYQPDTKILKRNNKFNVTQLYSARLKPNATKINEFIIAGAQDNGTHKLYGAPDGTTEFYNSTRVRGGDGAQVLYDNSSDYFITGHVYSSHKIHKQNGNEFYLLETSNRGFGHFINEITLDKNLDIAYSYKSGVSFFRMTNLSLATSTTDITTTTLSIPNGTGKITSLKVSPYTTNSTKLFIGLNNGQLWKVDGANGASPVYTNITSPIVGNISNINFGESEDDIIVTLSNFNVNNVWYSSDGGNTWQAKDGNLPDMPIRDAMFNPENENEVILATEVGVWATSNFTDSTPTWITSNNGLTNVRVTQLDYRESDGTILAATYGRGIYTSKFNSVECSIAPLIVSNINLDSSHDTEVIISDNLESKNLEDLMHKRAFLLLESNKYGLEINHLNTQEMLDLAPISGMVIWNSQEKALMFYNGTSWKKAIKCSN